MWYSDTIMKTLPIQQVIDLLCDRTAAIIVDNDTVTYACGLDSDSMNDDVFMSFETQYGEERFRTRDNATVLLHSDDTLVLVNTEGNKTLVTPLVRKRLV